MLFYFLLWWIYFFLVNIIAFTYCVYLEPHREHSSLQDGAGREFVSQCAVTSTEPCWPHITSSRTSPVFWKLRKVLIEGRMASFSLPDSPPPPCLWSFQKRFIENKNSLPQSALFCIHLVVAKGNYRDSVQRLGLSPAADWSRQLRTPGMGWVAPPARFVWCASVRQ